MHNLSVLFSTTFFELPECASVANTNLKDSFCLPSLDFHEFYFTITNAGMFYA